MHKTWKAMHWTAHRQNLLLLSTSHPTSHKAVSVQWYQFYRVTQMSDHRKKNCAIFLGSVNSDELKGTLFCNSELPHLKRREGSDHHISESSLQSQKQSRRTKWKYTRRQSTISTLIKQTEGLQFLPVVIQTNYHCTWENFSLKTNTGNKLHIFGQMGEIKPTSLTKAAITSPLRVLIEDVLNSVTKSSRNQCNEVSVQYSIA